jgi:uncharacterized protein involved in outer membrane biogenesis
MTTRTRNITGVLLIALAAAVVALIVSARGLEPRLHEWVRSTLSESLESDVELGRVHLSWVPLRLHATDLTVRHHGRTDIPPLIVVSSFTVDLRPMDLWSSTVDRVRVDGLEVNIPPKDPDTGKRPMPDPKGDGDGGSSHSVVIRHLTATNTRLAVIPRTSGKNPKVWDIYELDLKNLRGDEPATFTAALINPIPYGKIDASGSLGPWQSDEPGRTAVSGNYTFAADLGTIDGLGGQLQAAGNMSGTIEQISTTGTTHTPDFRLTELKGSSLPLETAYEAVVDGTEGDVELNRVKVTLGHSKFEAKGVVEGTHGIKGKRVVVNVKSDAANLGELLRFVDSDKPVADGVLVIDAALDLPQGKAPILDRLALEGSVLADQVKFTSSTVQDKIDELSRRAQGKPKDESIDNVASRMAAKFALDKGVFKYQGLTFRVRGADIRLIGTHSLRSKAIDFEGVALLNATVSKTQTGIKSLLLKPFDPLFRKDGAGTRLVITVAGTQDQPKIGLDFKKTIKGS